MHKITLFLFFSMFLFACSDPCDDVDCGANGTCAEDSGNCMCDDWYEGERCEIETRSKFIGIWSSTSSNCTDQNGGDLSPTWTIEALANSDGIRIRAAEIAANTWLDVTLTSDNTAVVTPVSLGGLEISGSISFINESSLSLNLNIGADCNFDLVK